MFEQKPHILIDLLLTIAAPNFNHHPFNYNSYSIWCSVPQIEFEFPCLPLVMLLTSWLLSYIFIHTHCNHLSEYCSSQLCTVSHGNLCKTSSWVCLWSYSLSHCIQVWYSEWKCPARHVSWCYSREKPLAALFDESHQGKSLTCQFTAPQCNKKNNNFCRSFRQVTCRWWKMCSCTGDQSEVMKWKCHHYQRSHIYNEHMFCICTILVRCWCKHFSCQMVPVL